MNKVKPYSLFLKLYNIRCLDTTLYVMKTECFSYLEGSRHGSLPHMSVNTGEELDAGR